MDRSEWDFHTAENGDDHSVLPETPEDRVDRFGLRTTFFVLCIAFFIAAIWLLTRPTFEKCNAVENVTERHTCFDMLRNEFLKPRSAALRHPFNLSVTLLVSEFGFSSSNFLRTSRNRGGNSSVIQRFELTADLLSSVTQLVRHVSV